MVHPLLLVLICTAMDTRRIRDGSELTFRVQGTESCVNGKAYQLLHKIPAQKRGGPIALVLDHGRYQRNGKSDRPRYPTEHHSDVATLIVAPPESH